MFSNEPSRDVAERAWLVHQEMVKVVLLGLAAVAGFFLTRAVAASNRDLAIRDAAEWFRRGNQFVAAGRIDDAVEAFRRARVRDHAERSYVLGLTQALVLKQDYDSARSILLLVREAAPEDPQINLDLARIAAARQDVTEALRFYHDALYAPWTVQQAATRRAVRIELIRFLLTHNQIERADAELLAAAADIPDDVVHHRELAALFVQAGDDRNGLDQLQRALRRQPDNPQALADAGQAAFRLGQYPLAQRYFHQLPSDADVAGHLRAVVDLVIARDPMAGRIGAHERQQRLEANASDAGRRISECLQRSAGASSEADVSLQSELSALEQRLRHATPLDQDTLESGLDLIARVEREAVARCGPATPVDEALLLIAREHGAGASAK